MIHFQAQSRFAIISLTAPVFIVFTRSVTVTFGRSAPGTAPARNRNLSERAQRAVQRQFLAKNNLEVMSSLRSVQSSYLEKE